MTFLYIWTGFWLGYAATKMQEALKKEPALLTKRADKYAVGKAVGACIAGWSIIGGVIHGAAGIITIAALGSIGAAVAAASTIAERRHNQQLLN